MNLITNFEGRILSDREYLEFLDYALDLVQDFEQQAEACCRSLRERAKTTAN
ncbi:hypothetical protein [Burkholderia anthina]|uniref:hypothetical protein n=1 Tax=Burkholderia anthina TaxID=179879 RepID=UPI000ADAECB1|nr:hypothetical protein [Burkholderia anthina]